MFGSKKRLTIALDIDGTYTEDIKMWDAFISLAQKSGHRVIIVTMRYDNIAEGKELREIFDDVCEVFFTSRKAKQPFLEALDITVDIWIDDNPIWILQDSG